MSDYPMLISNKLHSFRNFCMQRYGKILIKRDKRKTFSLYRHEKPTEAGCILPSLLWQKYGNLPTRRGTYINNFNDRN